MRHGKPSFDLEEIKSKKMPASAMGEIVKNYESSSLDSSFLPNPGALKISKECALLLSSDLPRAVLSSQLLKPDEKLISDSCFRESALPYVDWNFPKLTFFTWAVIFRLLWLVGFSKHGESIKMAKVRAEKGADFLEHYARKGNTVLLIGHGIMNRLLVRELISRKWTVTKKTGEKYWSYTVIEFVGE